MIGSSVTGVRGGVFGGRIGFSSLTGVTDFGVRGGGVGVLISFFTAG